MFEEWDYFGGSLSWTKVVWILIGILCGMVVMHSILEIAFSQKGYMGVIKNKHIEHLIEQEQNTQGSVFKVDKIAKSVAEENEMDEYRMRQYERDQEDLFDSMDYNWSGNR